MNEVATVWDSSLDGESLCQLNATGDNMKVRQP